jgi:hypothetical protein
VYYPGETDITTAASIALRGHDQHPQNVLDALRPTAENIGHSARSPRCGPSVLLGVKQYRRKAQPISWLVEAIAGLAKVSIVVGIVSKNRHCR